MKFKFIQFEQIHLKSLKGFLYALSIYFLTK